MRLASRLQKPAPSHRVLHTLSNPGQSCVHRRIRCVHSRWLRRVSHRVADGKSHYLACKVSPPPKLPIFDEHRSICAFVWPCCSSDAAMPHPIKPPTRFKMNMARPRVCGDGSGCLQTVRKLSVSGTRRNSIRGKTRRFLFSVTIATPNAVSSRR
ncbi:hypothetical protein BDM02DRAFT_2544110 [Thelephora ganbajun]|uniref:Uncharacterized protein n=1 Tax=Thelephora ganbajun TaxID=370292 RepID=A0ACB6ZSM3_THEGA|nr:hypothetical protein BDM02DRAFT_2544110 [Thelephora ganbajun]